MYNSYKHQAMNISISLTVLSYLLIFLKEECEEAWMEMIRHKPLRVWQESPIFCFGRNENRNSGTNPSRNNSSADIHEVPTMCPVI